MEGDSKALAEKHAIEHAESLNVPTKKMGVDVITSPLGLNYTKIATKIEAKSPERNPTFNKLLTEMRDTHDRKSKDYATDDNVYSNFEIAGQMGAMFSHPVDIAFAVLIGVKLARLAELKGRGKAPQNEAVADTHLDMSVYSALWTSWERDK
jgi:hypothetical protein